MKNYRTITSEELDKHQKEFVLEYLKEHQLVDCRDNMIIAPKAFSINAAFRWAINEMKQERMSINKWAKIKRMVSQYIAGIVELDWDDGELIAIENINDKERKRRKRK